MCPTIEAADYREISRVSEPRVHPDGDRVAFVRTDPHDDETHRATIFLVELDDGEQRQFTVAEGTDSHPRFSPSGDRLAFVSTRGTDDRPQLWVMPTTGGEARQVTDVVGGVSNLSWSPDGTRIAFAQSVSTGDRNAERDLDVPEGFEPEESDPRVIDRTVYRTVEGYVDGKHSHVYVVDLATETDEVTRITDWNDERGFRGLDWGDDATLYYTTTPEDAPDSHDTLAFELLAHDLETGDVESLTRTSGLPQSLAATADGRIVYPHLPDERTSLHQAELHVYDRHGETTHVPTEPLDRTVGGFVTRGAEWGPGEEYLYFVTPDEGSIVARRVRWDASEPPAVVAGDGMHVTEFSTGDGVLAFTSSEPDHPGDVFAVPLEGGADGDRAARRLTTVNADFLSDRVVAEPEEVWFEGPDGDEIQGWLLLPPEDARPDGQERFPLVVEIHGGPHLMWTVSGGWWWHEFQVMAARGYAVFWPNPRGSTGYGEAFMAATEGDQYAVTLADLEAGLDHVTQRDDVDGTQQFVNGFSFGGSMAAWCVGHTDRFEAAVAEAGNYDLTGFYGSSDGYRVVEWEFGTVPWEGADILHEHSPVAYADEIDAPTLVLHSERDFRTPINTAELFYRALRKTGVETRMVRYPREGHLLIARGEPAHVVDRLERIVRWFDGYCDYVDAPPALERTSEEGLSPGERSEREEDGSDEDGTAGE